MNRSTAPGDSRSARADRYAIAFTDWLACAAAGSGERAPEAVRASGGDLLARVAAAAAAGHVLDFDDTFPAGVAHLSAACAPAALVLAAELGLPLAAALDAYAAGFEAMAALAEASHPALYDGGWHPTAVCAPLGAAVVACELLGLSPEQRATARALSLLRAGGARGAFGSDAKAVQVALATAAGVQAALLARGGARVDAGAVDGPVGFTAVTGAALPRAGEVPSVPAIERNWIKLHPSCLGTHAPIEAAAAAAGGPREAAVEVRVHPLARQAAHLDAVETGLQAKFSIPYCVAHTLMLREPGVDDFAGVDPGVRRRAELVRVTTDPGLPEFGAVLLADGRELARVESPRGSPGRPAGEDELAAKVSELTGARLDGLLSDLGVPAADALRDAGLGSRATASPRLRD